MKYNNFIPKGLLQAEQFLRNTQHAVDLFYEGSSLGWPAEVKSEITGITWPGGG